MTDRVEAKKSLGQHWLYDLNALDSIVKAGNVSSDDTVLEIGPGTGSLTKLLVKNAKNVLALEYDSDLAQNLKVAKIAKNLQIIEGDIRLFDLAQLTPDYKIVANIPYYLTANLLRKLTDVTNKPSLAVLLVQKEVAQRIAAEPGAMSFISVAVQYFYEVGLGKNVPARLFIPPPKVDSQILILKRRPKPIYTNLDSEKFFKLIKIGFSSRRKTLTNNLKPFVGIEIMTNFLKKNNLSLKVRAQELTLEDWYQLYINTDYPAR